MPRELRDPFASADYLSPQLKPKAHLHVFYCAIMHHAIRWIKAGLLDKTFKYEELVADPHAVLAKLLALAGVPLNQVSRVLQAKPYIQLVEHKLERYIHGV